MHLRHVSRYRRPGLGFQESIRNDVVDVADCVRGLTKVFGEPTGLA
jgi:hypothetical protein